MSTDGDTEVNGASSAPPHDVFDSVLVLDCGSQYTHLITRRLRELNIYSEMLPCTIKLADLTWKKKPKAIIISGGPFSVYEPDAPHVDPAVFEAKGDDGAVIPVLGICYGMQEMAWHFGGNDAVSKGEKREYGHAGLQVMKHGAASVASTETAAPHVDLLFEGLSDGMDTDPPAADQKLNAQADGKLEAKEGMAVWMSHGDKLSTLPPNFTTTAFTSNAPFAGIVHQRLPYFGIQFHPEVTHTPQGTALLRNFAVTIAGASQSWTMDRFVEQEIARIRTLVGPTGQVIGAVSGGVDSTVAAKLMSSAIGDRFHAVLVDNGLLRANEAAEVHEALTTRLGINLTVVDASDRFLDLLAGITDDPERKRKVIGNTFIKVFQETALSIAAASATPSSPIEFLLQGTLYPDVIESLSFKGGPSTTIKTHHNVGGLLENMHLKLIEPLRELFKDEVRALGLELGLAPDLVWRHPFPGPGLAIRILGEVTRPQLRIAREADAIFISEIRAAGLYDKISQAFAALLPVRAVGVMGDKRVHEQVISLRAVETTDFMTADWFPFDGEFLKRVSRRIVNEVEGVCRVVYDVTSKPPGTIEME